MSFLAELKRRHVVRVALVYGAVSFAVLQAADLIAPRLQLPDWTVTLMVVLALLGLPVALVLAWAFELTPDGVRRTEPTAVAPAPERRPAWIGIRAAVTAVVLVTTGLFAGWFARGGLRSSADTADLPAIPSLAVLPLENVGGDAANASFAIGLHDDLLTRLSKIGGLRLVSRTSVREYADTRKNVREIGTELGVGHILEGSVQRAGEQVRINVQLIEAGTDRHLWAETYDQDLTVANLFAIQAEIAGAIARALHAELTGEARAEIARAPTDDLPAYDAYLRGLTAGYWDYGIGAAEAFAEATRLDPSFAAAYAGEARARAWLARIAFQEGNLEFARDNARRASEAAAKAGELAPAATETKLADGYVAYYVDWDLPRALARFREIEALRPHDAEVAAASGLILRRMGRWQDALAQFERTMKLDPRSDLGPYELSQTYTFLGNLQESLRYARIALQLRRSADIAQMLVYSYSGTGDTAALRHVIASQNPRAQDEVPDPWLLVTLGRADMEARLSEVLANPGGRARTMVFGAAMRWAHRLGDPVRQPQYADSLVTLAEAALRSLGADATGHVRSDAHRLLGTALAYRGDADEAVRHARRAVELIPCSLDAVECWNPRGQLLEVLVVAGRHDEAVAVARELLAGPSQWTPARLRTTPFLAPLYGREDFQQLTAAAPR
jgi:TolB-like protein/Flp pilus assembly protein TadD